VWNALLFAAGLAALAGTVPIASHGMRAAYFRTGDWTGEAVTRVDPRPSDAGVEAALGVDPPQHLSAQWIGALAVDDAGRYQLRITTVGSCRASVDDALQADSNSPGVPEATLARGVYTLTIVCSATHGKLEIGVWWDRAGGQPSALSPAAVFPYPITLSQYERVARLERAQRFLRGFAAALTLLALVEWARTRGRLAWAMLVASAATIAAVHADWPPWIRGPSEWQWMYEPGPVDRSVFPALAFGLAVLLAIGLAGTSHARRRPRAVALTLLGLGVVAGLGFQIGLLDIEPAGWRLTLIDGVWDALGYLRSAALVADRAPLDVLRHYPSIMPTLSFRASTHPPGATLMLRGLIWAARQAGLVGVNPAAALGSARVPDALALAKVALAGGLIWAASAALTALPVALAAWTLTRDPPRAVTVGLLWLFCASPVFFSPWLEQLDTLLVAASFALLAFAQSVSRRAILWSSIAGAIAGLAMFFSYGTAPMLAAAVLMAGCRADTLVARWRFVTTASWWLAAAGVVVLAPALVGFPVVATAREALEAHRRFTLSRSALLWQRYNLLDFAMGLGAPSVVMMVAVGLNRRRAGAAWRPAACVALVMLMTDLTGTARGEAARLWMPFMPLLFAAIWSAPIWRGGDAEPPGPGPRDAVAAGVLMMLYCITLRYYWIVP
jgi:hypothetical protein